MITNFMVDTHWILCNIIIHDKIEVRIKWVSEGCSDYGTLIKSNFIVREFQPWKSHVQMLLTLQRSFHICRTVTWKTFWKISKNSSDLKKNLRNLHYMRHVNTDFLKLVHVRLFLLVPNHSCSRFSLRFNANRFLFFCPQWNWLMANYHCSGNVLSLLENL